MFHDSTSTHIFVIILIIGWWNDLLPVHQQGIILSNHNSINCILSNTLKQNSKSTTKLFIENHAFENVSEMLVIFHRGKNYGCVWNWTSIRCLEWGRWSRNILLNLFNSKLIVRSIICPDYIKIDIFSISLSLVVYNCDGCTNAFECYDLMPLPGQSIFKKMILISHYLHFYDTSIIRYTLYDFICTHTNTNRSVCDSWIIWMISNYG